MGVGANAFRTDRKIVTICGSMRFAEHMRMAAVDYSLQGYVVLMPFVDVNEQTVDPFDQEAVDERFEAKTALDRLHLDKISMSSLVAVVTVDGYIGESTQNEISYAASEGKKIDFIRVDATKLPAAKKPKLAPEPEHLKGQDQFEHRMVSDGKVFHQGYEVDPATLQRIGKEKQVADQIEMQRNQRP